MTGVVSGMKYGWASQARQYAPTGEPGIHLEQHDVPGVRGPTVVDCLLYRDDDGQLLGIFNHYNENNLWQKPGSCNLWVHPDHQRKGIATDLLREADKLWELADQENYTPEGNAWIEGLVKKGKIDPTRTGSIEGDPSSISGRKVPRPCDPGG
jgi:GNAT superfamily N-acetyltransferase